MNACWCVGGQIWAVMWQIVCIIMCPGMYSVVICWRFCTVFLLSKWRQQTTKSLFLHICAILIDYADPASGALCYMGNVSIQECELPILTRQYLLSSWWSQLYMSQDQFITLWFEHFNLRDGDWEFAEVSAVTYCLTIYSHLEHSQGRIKIEWSFPSKYCQTPWKIPK